jgi:hypothetical protein
VLLVSVHYHLLGLDGVFTPAGDGTLRFHRLPPPTDADVARLVAAIARRGLGSDADATDPLAAESLALAGLGSGDAGTGGARAPRRRPGRAPGRRSCSFTVPPRGYPGGC